MILTEISSGLQENMGKVSAHVTHEKIINVLNMMESRSGQIAFPGEVPTLASEDPSSN